MTVDIQRVAELIVCGPGYRCGAFRQMETPSIIMPFPLCHIVAPALEGEWAGREEPPTRSPFYGPTAERSHGTQFLFDLMGFFIDRIADNDPVRSEIVGSR